MNKITQKDINLLAAFVDYLNTVIIEKDGNKMIYRDNQPISAEELAYMFLDSDLSPYSESANPVN